MPAEGWQQALGSNSKALLGQHCLNFHAADFQTSLPRSQASWLKHLPRHNEGLYPIQGEGNYFKSCRRADILIFCSIGGEEKKIKRGRGVRNMSKLRASSSEQSSQIAGVDTQSEPDSETDCRLSLQKGHPNKKMMSND